MTDASNGGRAKINRDGGFTLLELMVVIAIIGILATISGLNAVRYRNKAELAAMKAQLHVLMNAEDAYYITQGKYFPLNGTINIPSGIERKIPELGFTFKKGHQHRYYLYGYNLNYGPVQYNYCYIIIYADRDYDGNGSNDMYYCLTYIYNGKMTSHRQFYQLR